MKVREYVLLRECVEKGVQRGLHRAYKHSENPDHDQVCAQIENCVMAEIIEYFIFPDEENDLH